MKIAAVNWKLRPVASEGEFFGHLRELLDKCSGCQIVVLPEMFGLELLSLAPGLPEKEYPAFLAPYFGKITIALKGWEPGQEAWTLVGGSNVIGSGGRFYNRTPVITQSREWHQDKVMPTEWEKGVGLSGGRGLRYDEEGWLGVTVCYDSEFPGSARALAEAGAELLCVPAWTETMQGFRRVRWCCQARAVENQILVVHSSLVGKVEGLESHGSSAIIAPPHPPFGNDPILAETRMDEEEIAFALVEPGWTELCREQGEVRNWRDRDAGDWTVHPV